MNPAPAPRARREPKVIEAHGTTRIDDYAWLKDENWQKVLRDPSVLRPDIRAHLEAENAYTAATLAGTAALQAQLLAEMTGRMAQDEMSLPAADGIWDYYIRYREGAQQPLHARRPRRDADATSCEGEEILLDADALAQGHAYFTIAAASHSPDHRFYAWAEDTQGSEVYRIRIKDLASGETSPTAIENASGNFVFSPDSGWIFWTYRDENGRPTRIYRRAVSGGDDVLVYGERDPGFFIDVSVSESRHWIVISCGDRDTSEHWLIPAAQPEAAPRVFVPRETGLRYDVTHWPSRDGDGLFVIRTNADDATDFKVMQTDAVGCSRAGWTPLVPHRPGVLVAGISAFKDHLVRVEREDANTRIVVRARDGHEHAVAVDEDAYVLRPAGSYEYDTACLRYVYESPTTPRQWIDYDMATRAAVLRKTQQIPSGHDPQAYVARRLHAIAPDGASVPVTVLMRRDARMDGTAPLFLYGYGAYGHAIDPGFSTRCLSLVDRGWIYAIAHVRGGSEKGWRWFLDGRLEKKTNSFTDFAAAAEHLTEAGYGAPGRIVAHGASAGGMLMGAIANSRPDLWAGIAASVPFVDVLNTMCDADLPLTPPEWPEWGNPITDANAFRRIAAYSPYDAIHDAAYPAILATAGLSDPRVTYWEPAKWVARLRDHHNGTAPILLKTNMEAGHGGASGRFAALKEVALVYAFAVWAAGRVGSAGDVTAAP